MGALPAFLHYISTKERKDETSLLQRKSYLLEVGSDKAKTVGFYLGLLLCGNSNLGLLMEILIPVFVTSLIGENLYF